MNVPTLLNAGPPERSRDWSPPSFVRHHYSRFGVFLFKISMHVKTVQIEFFVIEIIISIHILSLEKVLPKCEI